MTTWNVFKLVCLSCSGGQLIHVGLRFFDPLPASGSTWALFSTINADQRWSTFPVQIVIATKRWNRSDPVFPPRWSTSMVLNKAQSNPKLVRGQRNEALRVLARTCAVPTCNSCTKCVSSPAIIHNCMPDCLPVGYGCINDLATERSYVGSFRRA